MAKKISVEKILASRKRLHKIEVNAAARDEAAEGGCGVIGIACSVKIPGRHLLQSLIQMRNRGNGKGGGIAAVGLVPEEFGVSRKVMEGDYLIAVAYLDQSVREEVEQTTRFLSNQRYIGFDERLTVHVVSDNRDINGIQEYCEDTPLRSFHYIGLRDVQEKLGTEDLKKHYSTLFTRTFM